MLRFRFVRRSHGPIWYTAWTRRRVWWRRSVGMARRFHDAGKAADHELARHVLEPYWNEHGRYASYPTRIRYAINHLEKFWGETRVGEITREQCRRYIAWRREHAKEPTIRYEMLILRAALGHAFKQGRLNTIPDVEVPPNVPPRDRWLRPEEIRRLLAECHLPHLRLFVTIAVGTGARSGAILDLTWSQVDLKRGRIDFNPPGRPETTKKRPVVPISDALLPEMRAARAMAKTEHVIEYRGKRLHFVKKAFRDACLRAGLKDVSPHILRHTAGTLMAQAGVNFWEIAGMLGVSENRAAERYAHHHPDYLERAKSSLGQVLDFAIGKGDS